MHEESKNKIHCFPIHQKLYLVAIMETQTTVAQTNQRTIFTSHRKSLDVGIPQLASRLLLSLCFSHARDWIFVLTLAIWLPECPACCGKKRSKCKGQEDHSSLRQPLYELSQKIYPATSADISLASECHVTHPQLQGRLMKVILFSPPFEADILPPQIIMVLLVRKMRKMDTGQATSSLCLNF